MEQAMSQDASTGMVTGGSVKKNTGLIAGIVVCTILAIGGVGFGVYGMMQSSQKDNQISDLKVQVTDNDGTITTLETEEVKVSDDSKTITISDSGGAYATRDLKNKTLRLLGSRNGFSIHEYYDDDTNSFMVYSDYMPIAQLLTNELDDFLKTYMTLETTVLDKDKICSYQWDDGVKSDINAALGETASRISFGDAYIDCITYDKANEDYNDLWGESISKINGYQDNTMGYGDFAYGSNLDAYYYHAIGGRGGTCSGYIVGRITQVDKQQNSAYVDINAGRFGVCAGSAGELYTDIKDGELYKTIEQDNINWKGLGLTEEDYNSLQSYRFVFKKNSDGIYSFSSVEKI